MISIEIKITFLRIISYILILSGLSNTNMAIAYTQSQQSPVHQHIAWEAFFIWPNDTSHEIYTKLNEGTPWDTSDSWDEENGNSIIEGAWAEDEFDPAVGEPFTSDGTLSNFNQHFWDCDLPGDITETGLPLDLPLDPTWLFWSAMKKALFYWSGTDGIEPYPWLYIDEQGHNWYEEKSVNFEGLINLYLNGEKDKAYFYLGRIVHLLSDMSVPAHVHNDAHIINDNYEKYVEDHWHEVRQNVDGNGHLLKLIPTNYESLYNIFWNQAQLTQNFPSNNADGNTENLDTSPEGLGNGWEWNRNQDFIQHPYSAFWPVAQDDGWVGTVFNPNEMNLDNMINSLLPLNMMYVANLYKLFWDTVHPYPVNVNASADTDEGTATVTWEYPENALVQPSKYRIYYGTNTDQLTSYEEIGDIDETNFIFEDLDGNEIYYFAVTALDDKGIESNKSDVEDCTISDSVSPSDISGFSASPDIFSTYLSWTNPSDQDFESVLIVRSTAPISWYPDNGEQYYGEVSTGVYEVYDFYLNDSVDYNLDPGTTYFYKAFAYDEVFNYSAGVSISTTTLPIAPPSETQPGNFRGTTTYSSVNLYWEHSLNANYRNYIVVRGTWSPSNDHYYNVGENGIIFKGNYTNCGNGGLKMGTDYYFAIYSYYQYQSWDEENQIWVDHIDYSTGVGINLHTNLGGTLSENLTLSKGRNPHIVEYHINIPVGFRLTIEPGAIIKFAPGRLHINVNGTLVADGNLPDGVNFEPIYITSIHDHSIGGGTGNGDPQKGDWDAINFQSSSTNSLMRHVIVKYGGNQYNNFPGSLAVSSSSLEIANCEFSDNDGGILILDSSPRITNSVFLNNAGWGLHCSGSNPEITHSLFRENSIMGIYCSANAQPIVEYNTFDSNGNAALYLEASSSGATIANNTFIGTSPFAKITGGTLSMDTTWGANMPYIIVDWDINVPVGVTLTIEPGAIIKFETRWSINVNGTLVADGNLPDGVNFEPIYITSIHDHSIGGGTGNGDPQIGDWDAINFQSSSTNSLMRHVIVKYGGNQQYNFPGSIAVYSSSLDIANCEFSDNDVGIYIEYASPRITNSVFLNNSGLGIYCSGSNPEITHSLFQGNTVHGIYCYGNSQPTIQYNTFDSNGNAALYLEASSSGATIANNTFIGTSPFAKITGGTLSMDTTWGANMPYIIVDWDINVPVGVTLTIEPGAIIKFETRWSINVNGTLVADGSLPDGVNFEPIYITSIHDHSIGGGTGNGDPQIGDWDAINFQSSSTNSLMRHVIVKYGGNQYNNFPGSLAVSSSSLEIANCEFSDNDGGVLILDSSPRITNSVFLNNAGWGLHCSGSNPEITHSFFQENSIMGIYCSANAQPIVEYNTFDSNGSYGIFNNDNSVIILAQRNYWGDPSGPYDPSDDSVSGGWYNPDGTGDSVSDHVSYEPWISDLNDIDVDDIPDDWEIFYFSNLAVVNEFSDFDGDGLIDYDEYIEQTNPKNVDSDSDGMPDGWEVDNVFNPLTNDAFIDSDTDGYCNLREYLSGSNPNNILEIPSILADYDSDSDVDGIDLVEFIGEFGREDCEINYCEYDFNYDGVVNGIDLFLFTEDIGRIVQ